MQTKIENKYLKLSIVTLILLFFSFPIIQDLRPMYKEATPHGVPPAKQYHSITIKSFLNGKWQKRVTERAKLNSGLWRPLLSVGSQLMLSLFSQVGIYQNGSVFLGKEKYLIQDAHLGEFNHRKVYSSKLEQQLIKFKKIQDYQSKRGKSFILLITPNLIHLYPELLPDPYNDPTKNTRESRYDHFKKQLDQMGIYYVDSAELLINKKDKYPFRFFARTASHWNDVASCLALHEISTKLQNLKLPNLGNFDCNNYTISEGPKSKDTDLLDMVNLFDPTVLHEPTPYVERPLRDPNFQNPKVLLVGTSYLIALYKHLKDWQRYENLSYYFYFKQFKTPKSTKFHTLRRASLKWDDILDRDIIIVNIGVSDLSSVGSGFIEEALAHIPH